MPPFYVNGMPLRGAAAPLGARVSPHLEVARQGLQVPLHPALSGGIDSFVRVNRPPRTPVILEPNPLWIGPTRHRNRWTELDSVALNLVHGRPEALDPLRKILGEGMIAEMRMAFETTQGIVDVERRNSALLRLRSLEQEFDEYRKGPKGISFDEKNRLVIPFTNAASQATGFDVDNYRTPGIYILDLFFNLVQLHLFLRQESHLLEPFEGGVNPSTVTDFLLGELGLTNLSGACHPLSLLAAHLGRRMGLPLRSYFSEEHVTLFVDAGPGFVYDPTQPLLCFLPPDIFVKEKRAPKEERPYDLDLLALEMGLNETFWGSDFHRQADAVSFLIGNIAPKMWILWHRLGDALVQLNALEQARLAVEKGLEIFPESLPLLDQYSDLLARMGDEISARRVFRRATRIFKERARLGTDATPSPSLLRAHSALGQRFPR